MKIQHGGDIRFYIIQDRNYKRFILLNDKDHSFHMIDKSALEFADKLESFINNLNESVIDYPFAELVTIYVFRLHDDLDNFEFRVSSRMGIFYCYLNKKEQYDLITALKGESHANKS